MAELYGYGIPDILEPYVKVTYDLRDGWKCMILTKIIPLREDWRALQGAQSLYTYKGITLDVAIDNACAAMDDAYNSMIVRGMLK
jgi:hypothetical protein